MNQQKKFELQRPEWLKQNSEMVERFFEAVDEGKKQKGIWIKGSCSNCGEYIIRAPGTMMWPIYCPKCKSAMYRISLEDAMHQFLKYKNSSWDMRTAPTPAAMKVMIEVFEAMAGEGTA